MEGEKGARISLRRRWTLPLNSHPLQQEGNRSRWTPERSRLCSQRAECRVAMAAVGLKANPFIALHILQYSFEFRHPSLNTKFPEERFLRGGGNSKDLRRNDVQHSKNTQSQSFVLP